MTKLRKALGLALVPVLLTACGQNAPAATPETADTAETAVTWTMGNLEPLPWANDRGYYFLEFHSFDGNGRWPYYLVSRVDFDTGEVTPVCNKPGCSHDSTDCLAFSDINYAEDTIIPMEDGSVLLYHQADSTEVSQDKQEQYGYYLDYEEARVVDYPGEAGRKYVEAVYESAGQPSYVDRISADGLTRERLAVLPDDLGTYLKCWDGQALYGSLLSGNLDIITENRGVRVGLDGQVSYFDLPDPYYTEVRSGCGPYLLLSHTSSPVDLRTMYLYGNYNAFYTLREQADQECWLYDPVQGTTQKLDLPYENLTNFVGMGDRIVYTAVEDGEQWIYIYDLTTGETGLGIQGSGSMIIKVVPAVGRQPRYVRANPQGQDALVDMDTGNWWTTDELMEMTGMDPGRYDLGNALCETRDGRLLLQLYDMGSNPTENVYTTIPSPALTEGLNLTQQALEEETRLLEEAAEMADVPQEAAEP